MTTTIRTPPYPYVEFIMINQSTIEVTVKIVPTYTGGFSVNDPSAGSPTETLLRLLLPLNAQAWAASR